MDHPVIGDQSIAYTVSSVFMTLQDVKPSMYTISLSASDAKHDGSKTQFISFNNSTTTSTFIALADNTYRTVTMEKFNAITGGRTLASTDMEIRDTAIYDALVS